MPQMRCHRSAKLKGQSTRIGVYKCRDCRKPFTVKVGTIKAAKSLGMDGSGKAFAEVMRTLAKRKGKRGGK